MFEQINQALAGRLTSDSKLTAWRQAGLARLQTQGLPGPRDEAWRYAPIRGLERQSWTPANVAHADRSNAIAGQLPPSLPGFSRVVIVDGAIDASLSGELAAPFVADGQNGVDAFDPLAVSSTDAASSLANNSFAIIGRLLSDRTLQFVLAAGTQTRLQLVFVSTVTAREAASPTTLRLTVAAGSHAQVVEEHLALAGTGALANHVVDAELEPRAQLRWTRVLASGADGRHIETLRLKMAEDAGADLLQIAPGNAALRSTVVATLDGARSRLQFATVALGDGSQHLDQHVLIDHRGTDVKSYEVFRGLASGRSRVAFTGHNRVLPTATNTDTRQSLRSLITGTEAEAIARPQLEILTDAVKAAHGATVGTLDPQMLFYLLSRGLDPLAAQSLLKWAFLQDVLSQLQPIELRTRLETLLLARLHDPLLAELAP